MENSKTSPSVMGGEGVGAEGLVEKVTGLLRNIDLNALRENEWVEKAVDGFEQVPEKTWYGLAAGSAVSSALLYFLTEQKKIATFAGILAPAFFAAGYFKNELVSSIRTGKSTKIPTYHH